MPADLVVRDPDKLRWGTVSTIRAPARVSNGQDLRNAHVDHTHAPFWEVFSRHLKLRVEKGAST